MEDIVHAIHYVIDAVAVADIADIKRQPRFAIVDAHQFLLEFITAEDADLLDFGFQQTVDHRLAKGARAAGY